MITVKSCSYGDTLAIGAKTAAAVKDGGVMLLFGGLGVGKTAFTKGVAEALNIDEHVVSPTFTLLNIYSGDGLELCHFDLYRLGDDIEAIAEAGLDEFFYRDNTLCVIEWPECAEEMLNGPYIKVTFTINDDESRDLCFEAVGMSEDALSKALTD